MSSQNKKSVNLLPEFIRTDKNSKFLYSTIDQLNQTPQIERIDGFVGSKLSPNYNPNTDFYLNDPLPLRASYQLTPAMVFRDSQAEITDVVSFDDLINEIGIQYKNNKNLNELFSSRTYSYDPLIDWDKLINYVDYYWLVDGPELITIDSTGINVDIDIVGKTTYLMPNGHYLSNGMKIAFSDNVNPVSYKDKEYIVEGVGTSIKLIDFSLLETFDQPARVYDEKFDDSTFDNFPFDADRKLPLDPEYITINRASKDLNPWTRYNRWFHKDVISTSLIINNQTPSLNNLKKASRPIVEFVSGLQLYKFGKKGIRNVDLIDNTTTQVFETVNQSFGYYVDGKLIEDGNRIIFNAAIDSSVRGKIYVADYVVIGGERKLTLIPSSDFTPDDLDSVSVNYGNSYTGSSWYYVSADNKWYKSQERTVLNQFPLFDLFDAQGQSYSQIEINDFQGNQIFGYDVAGSGTVDPVLKFPLKYQNSVGVGSFLFKNYFMTGVINLTSNNITRSLPTSITLIKKYRNDGSYDLVNVWRQVKQHMIPILEFQTPVATTSTLQVKSLEDVAESNLRIRTYVNEKLVSTTSTVIRSDLFVNFPTAVDTNDRVLFKIYSKQIPNSNGYYDTPLSLTNNPLNNPISDMTLSELADHLETMIDNFEFESNSTVDRSKLRDVNSTYTSFGTRLVINENPISFSQIFLGKKEHNVIDAIRSIGDRYGQFKMNFLRLMVDISEQLSPVDAVDTLLKEINKHKDLKSPFFRSDMLPYGGDKKITTFVVSDPAVVEYPINFDFNDSILSFKSVLVYLNGNQLIRNKDYHFDNVDNTVIFSAALSIGDVISINCYSDTRGSFVPPTPSKLGLYPKFEPLIYQDSSYSQGTVTFIRGHDGSLVRAYGDYRDAIILEYEKRVYNNIKVNYNPSLYNIFSVMPGAFRTTDYTLDEFNDVIVKDFIKWAGTFNVDAYSNTGFDEGNPYTWNYKGSTDTLFNTPLSGTWRSLYRYFFDTDRPHTHPWEMLGHMAKPSWWDTYYSWTNTPKRAALISAITQGKTQEPPSSYVNPVYSRPNFSSVVPVDVLGNLLSPDEFLVNPNGYADKISSWQFGDLAPAELSWRNSSYWPFVLISAAAVLDPCCYLTRMYDVSRTGFNSLGQLIYLNDDLYLNPSKLIIEGTDDQQISGYGSYVIEQGSQKVPDYANLLKQDLTYLNFNLFHKLGGFTGKDKLQILIDSIDPVSRSPGAILPPEDFSLILNVSNPIKTLSISGIVIQKSNGKFIIKGYDKNNPYFEILKPIKTAMSESLTIGGTSESYVEWKSSASLAISGSGNASIVGSSQAVTKYYKIGQIVLYNGRYYRVKIGHNAQATFDPALFQLLPTLPITGGATVQLPVKFETQTTEIPYGSEFSTIQDVYDVIVGYGAWLESQGFIFDSYNDDFNDIVDWRFTGKEFLYWTTQNWADNSIIALSPFADYLKYQYVNSIVDNILGGKYEYSLLKADGRSYPLDKFSLTREDGFCVVKSVDTEEGIFFATLRLIQKEHAIVLNNTTIFNDTIYDIETGYRQNRIKLSGFRTKDWNGDLFSPGFVYDEVKITDWKSYGTYLPGAVVRFNGAYYESSEKVNSDEFFDFNKWIKLSEKPVSQLLPNFDYKINQFEDFYSLDIDNFDFGQQVLAQHLTGYTPRNYLNNIFTNPVSQYKFYQGFIREKGTKNAISKLSKVNLYNRQGNVDITEEWAFRSGAYGSFSTYKEIEVALLEGTYLENPYLIKLVDKTPVIQEPLTHYVSTNELLSRPENYKPSTAFVASSGTFFENNLELTTAGYVRLDDITATAYNKNSLLDIANNSTLREGDTVWTGFLENGDWTVYRYSRQIAKISSVAVSIPGSRLTFSTDAHHDLSVGDIISVVEFDSQVDGIYIITDTPSLNEFTVASSLSTILEAEVPIYGLLYKFVPSRFSNFTELTNKNFVNFETGEKIWIDEGTNNRWEVYEKARNYSSFTTVVSVDPSSETANSFFGQQLGYTIYTSELLSKVLVSSPGWVVSNAYSRGKISVYDKQSTGEIVKKSEYFLNSSDKFYCDPALETEFGSSITYDEGKNLIIVGAPASSNIRSLIISGQVVISEGVERPKSFSNEGLVKIISSTSTATTVLVNPFAVDGATAENSRFGHSVYINQLSANNPTLLLVSAPGDFSYTGTGAVYAYQINSTGTISAHISGLVVDADIELNSGAQWGYKISGDRLGNRIAISAPGYLKDGRRGVIQVFDKDLTLTQSIYNPFENEGRFGDDVHVSNSGKYLFVSSTDSRKDFESFGKVAVYTLNSQGQYILSQVLENPLSNYDLKFGYSISLSNNEQILTVSALGTSRTQILDFDSYGNNETFFNEDTTKFVSEISDAGVVHVYNKLGEYFIHADVLDAAEIFEGSKYGFSVVATDNDIFVGAPSRMSSGVVEIVFNDVPIVVDKNTTVFVEFGSDPDLPNGVKPIAEIQYTNITDSTKTISTGSVRIVVEGSGYSIAPTVTLRTECDVLSEKLTAKLDIDKSRFYQFRKTDSSLNSWNLKRFQPNLINVNTIKRIALIDSFKEEIIEYLDVVDPLKGKIAGIADQELTYKSTVDPAVYTLGLAGTVNDTNTNWLDEHVGELWWDLSTAKYVWYEQGDDVFRKNNWGRLFPGSSIDVYEWVRSDLLPSEWAAQADTNAGLTSGISGQPKYPDNSVISVKQVLNNITGVFENVYYFWVKNKLTVPDVRNRRISAYQTASIISDPIANGLKFAEILSSDAVAFANVQPMLVGNKVNVNIAFDSIDNPIPRHTEWTLLQEGSVNSVPGAALEKKLFDSLLGHDSQGNPVPDPALSYRNRYGIEIRPRQSMFKDRLSAIRNLFEFANSVLEKNRITGNYNFDNLNNQDQIPDIFARDYDEIVESIEDLEEISVDNFKRAVVKSGPVVNGKIASVIIEDPGFGYLQPPRVIVKSSEAVEILTSIDSEGRVIAAQVSNPGEGLITPPLLEVRPYTVYVIANKDYANKWTKHEFNYDYTSSLDKWVRTKTQTHDTTKYWTYIDWVSENYNQYRDIDFFVSDIYKLNSLYSVPKGSYVKVQNIGDGRYAILEKIDSDAIGNFIPSYNIVFSQNGTIKFLDTLWNYKSAKYSYDDASLEETLYDQIPDLEIYYILTALKNDIFIKELTVNWNLFFFKAVRYALTEQKLLDWAFKTSFITVKNSIGSLDQRPIYKLDNEQYVEQYIKEVKPYHTQIRNYTSAYDSFETANLNTSDFDLPPYFNTSTNKFESVSLGNPVLSQQPWKSWSDNYKSSIGSVELGFKGRGYNQRPTVNIITAPGDSGSGATAEAYIRNGQIYSIIVTNPGSGYVIPPTVVISGGGASTTATAVARLLNEKVRKNIIGIKFDRITSAPEMLSDFVSETFVCDGNTNQFELKWLVDENKSTIKPLLDGKLIFSSDYELTTETRKVQGITQKYTQVKLLKTIPLQGQQFVIEYKKNLSIYSAVDRVTRFYSPSETMAGLNSTMLMSGAEYPNTVIQGLPFDYSVPWDNVASAYDTSAWGDLSTNYLRTNLVSTATVGTELLFLKDVSGIQPGQSINILNTPTRYLSTDTRVGSVYTETNSISLLDLRYNIRSVRALGTSTGSTIVIKTRQKFYDAIKENTKIFVLGVVAAEYNGYYSVNRIVDNNTLEVSALVPLTTATTTVNPEALIKVSSILRTIESGSVLIENATKRVSGVSTATLITESRLDEVAKSIVKVNGSNISQTLTPTSYYYDLVADPNVPERAAIVIHNLPLVGVNNIDIELYADPVVEFWTNNSEFNSLDTALSGGSWNNQGQFMGAAGVSPDEIVVDGHKFLSIDSGYSTEELVKGHVVDSLGINVYTKEPRNHVIAISGAVAALANQPTEAVISVDYDNSMGIMVYSDEKIFNRRDNLDFEFDNEYFISGNVITISPQPVNRRIGFSVVGTSSGDYVDLGRELVQNTDEVIVQSLARIDDIQAAYVLVDGEEISEISTSTDYGYVLTNVSPTNNRACVKVYNLPPGANFVEAWFFTNPFSKITRVSEEVFALTTSSQTSFVLSKPPSNIEPSSAKVLVELIYDINSSQRKRLLPPWISYYQVDNNQNTFAIDSKNPRDPGTYSLPIVKAYVNGVSLRPGFDYTVDSNNSTVTIVPEIVKNGDVVAVMGMIDYDYAVSGNVLQLNTPALSITPTPNSYIRVISFNDADRLMLRTERFNGNEAGRFTLSRPVLDDNYVWVTIKGIPLIARYDFEILEDLKTVQLSEWVEVDMGDDVLISTLNVSLERNTNIGFRIFKDMFDRYSYKRLSKDNSTFLTKELYITDTEIHVNDASVLSIPDASRNIPGVVIIDAERIEFFVKEGNVLKQLRRGTLGTAPSLYSEVRTSVLDQSQRQNVPYRDSILSQKFLTTSTNTYVISTVSNVVHGDGIVLNPNLPAKDQIFVYYGGRMLRKMPLRVQTLDNIDEIIEMPPEFEVDGLTNELVLNIAEPINSGTMIAVVQKLGTIWTGTESIVTSDALEARFLRNGGTDLPDIYYYGGDPVLRENNNFELTDDNDDPLEEGL